MGVGVGWAGVFKDADGGDYYGTDSGGRRRKWADGDVYDGEWKDDKMNGRGAGWYCSFLSE